MPNFTNTLDTNERYFNIFPTGNICFEYLENIYLMLDSYSYSFIATYLERILGLSFHPDIGEVLGWIKINKGETGLFRTRTIGDLIYSLERCPFIQQKELTSEDLYVLVEFSEFTYGKF